MTGLWISRKKDKEDTLDHFAGIALRGIIETSNMVEKKLPEPSQVAKVAYLYAYAMMAEKTNRKI